jgi:cytochrome c biogenesis protein CcdA
VVERSGCRRLTQVAGSQSNTVARILSSNRSSHGLTPRMDPSIVAFAYLAGNAATVNPCGFAMLPAFASFRDRRRFRR